MSSVLYYPRVEFVAPVALLLFVGIVSNRLVVGVAVVQGDIDHLYSVLVGGFAREGDCVPDSLGYWRGQELALRLFERDAEFPGDFLSLHAVDVHREDGDGVLVVRHRLYWNVD